MSEISVDGLDKKGQILKKRFSVKVRKSERYLIFDAVSEVFPFFRIKIFKNSSEEDLTVVYGKGRYCIDLGGNKRIDFESEYNNVRFSGFRISKNKNDSVLRMTMNTALNMLEASEGKTVLDSFPVYLGIDIYGRCNMNPKCAYCDYYDIKKKEGKHVDDYFGPETLDKLGRFFTDAERMINCSIGEPFLSPKIKEVIDKIDREGKYLELATNASLLTKDMRKHLLDKKIILSITVNATTEETFRKIRDAQFKKIIRNVEKLAEERKNKWPIIQIVFIPMKANLPDFKKHLEFCDKVADRLVIRPLNRGYNLKSARSGYRFVYEEQYPDEEDWKMIKDEIKKFRQKSSLPIIISSENETKNPEMAKGVKFPVCVEPWFNYYVLRRGVFPCCHGYKPIGDINDFEKLWNGKEIRELRKSLAEGKFSNYCLNSLSCPKVQKYMEEERMRNPLYRIVPKQIKQLLSLVVPIDIRRKAYRAMPPSLKKIFF